MEGENRKKITPDRKRYILTDLPTGWYAPEILHPDEDVPDPDGDEDLPDPLVALPLIEKGIQRLRAASKDAGGDLVAPSIETIERWRRQRAGQGPVPR